MEVEKILETTSGEEKISIVCASCGATASGEELPSLKIERQRLFPREDAILPSAFSLACSWDKDAAYAFGREKGHLCCSRGIHVTQDIPPCGVVKDVLNGERSRYLSTDGVLSAYLAAAAASGVQSTGVGACPEVDFESAKYLCGEKPVVKARAAFCKTEAAAQALKEGGYSGIVLSEFGAVKSPATAMASGVDMIIGGDKADEGSLLEGMLSGVLTGERLSSATRKILELVDDTYDDHEYEVDEEKLRENLLATALGCPVLLKNEGALPILGDSVTVMGALADGFPIAIEQGGERAAESLTSVFKEDRRVKFASGYTCEEDIDEALQTTYPDETVVVMLGYPISDVDGLERDRRLPKLQCKLVERLSESGRSVVAVVVGGGEMCLEEIECADAILFVPYLGSGAAKAVKMILCGESVPSGRLPETFYGADGKRALYRLGYGKSYGKFEYGQASFCGVDGQESVTLTVFGDSRYSQTETVQVYTETAGEKRLLAFEKVKLRAGEKRTVTIMLPHEFSGEKLLIAASENDIKSVVELSGRFYSALAPIKEENKVEDASGEITVWSTLSEVENTAGGKRLIKQLKALIAASVGGDEVRSERILVSAMQLPLAQIVRLSDGNIKQSEIEACVLSATGKPFKALMTRLKKK